MTISTPETSAASTRGSSVPEVRPLTLRHRGIETADGGGVRLTRILGAGGLEMLDPFLMLDEFGSDRPQDYLAGFPDHPHRGFETVTYMLAGRMRHGDNQGHSGVVGPGGVQWMTAGRGLVHSETPEQQDGLLRGFQLWLNLPAARKFDPPRYQEIPAERIPEVTSPDGATVRVIAGTLGDGTQGAVLDIVTDPTYLDVHLPPQGRFAHTLPETQTAFVYVYEGAVDTDDSEEPIERGTLAVLGPGRRVEVRAVEASTRLLLIAAEPLNEPVARMGPFVMNTQEQIRDAFRDFRNSRF